MYRLLVSMTLALSVFAVPVDADGFYPEDVVEECVSTVPDIEGCLAAVQAWADSVLCSAGFGCYYCAEFTAMDGGDVKAPKVGNDPLTGSVLTWHGLGSASSHDFLVPGFWEIRTSKSQEIYCPDDES